MGKLLYLHWGPGSNAAMERLWFTSSEDIDWWDQPLFGEPTPPDAFNKTVDAAEKRLLELSRQEGDSKIALIAHSFGGQIATALASRQPGKISSITLAACSPNPPQAFLNLGHRLLAQGSEGLSPKGLELLRASVESADASFTPMAFWALIGSIAAIPGFIGYYFHPDSTSTKARFLELAQKVPPMDMATFSAVMNSYLQAEATLSKKSPYTGPVRFLCGTEDPLASPEADFAGWKARFPQIQSLEWVKSGHFIQFEAPSALGLSSPSSPQGQARETQA